MNAVDSRNSKSQLQRERERRGWSRKYVAINIGVSEYTIGQWERGAHTPYPVHIEKLCMFFDTSAETLGLVNAPRVSEWKANKEEGEKELQPKSQRMDQYLLTS